MISVFAETKPVQSKTPGTGTTINIEKKTNQKNLDLGFRSELSTYIEVDEEYQEF